MMVCLGAMLLAAVVATSGLLQARSQQHRMALQRATERQALSSLRAQTSEVLVGQSALVRMLGSLHAPIGPHWPALANIALSQSLATVTYFVQPVRQRALAAFQRRTGLLVFDVPVAGADPRPAPTRPLHLVLRYGQQKEGPRAPVGLDLASDPTRRAAMLQSARTGRAVATPPVDFMVGHGRYHHGVIVYAAVRDARGHLLGWVACDYATDELLSAMARLAPRARWSIRDHGVIVAGGRDTPGGLSQTLDVGGRRWTASAYVSPGPGSATPWLVLACGLALSALVLVALAQSASRARHALALVAAREREDAARLQADRARDHAQTIIAAMAEGYALTADDRLVDVNDALCEMTGFSRQQLLGTAAPYPFWPAAAAVADTGAMTVDATAREVTLIRRGGESFEAELTTRRAHTSDGTMLGHVTTIRDVSERVRRDRHQMALRRLAQLVAGNVAAEEVFSTVAAEVVALFDAHSGMVTQFDRRAGVGRRLGGQRHDGRILAGATYALDGDSVSAMVFRTGRTARLEGCQPGMPKAAVAALHAEGVGAAIAAPVVVSGRPWGTLAIGFSGRHAPPGAEDELGRFSELVAMAIANAETLQTLARRAATDSITGLANHHAFQERVPAEVKRARRHHRALSLVLLDVDHFKAVNDTHGHPVGDRVLADIARRLRDNARDEELVARVGGEEFAWLMPDTDVHGAYRAAERLRREIEATTFADVGRLTVSVGVCACPPGDDLQASDLVRLADRALYWAKEDGRNTTFIYSEERAVSGMGGRGESPAVRTSTGP